MWSFALRENDGICFPFLSTLITRRYIYDKRRYNEAGKPGLPETDAFNDNPMHYCPGCSHGVVHKLVAEVIEEMGMTDKTIGISPVGCAVFMYNYLDVDCLEAAHGRAPALAGAIKRLWPDRLVFTYQGDGDLACIGTAETIHSLNRGDNITIIL